MNNNKNNCLICGGKIIYSQTAQKAECEFCHRIFQSEAKCENGHFICDECHAKPAFNIIMDYCLNSNSKNPLKITTDLMKHPSIHMHGPEHHVLFPSAMLTAYHNAGGSIDLAEALKTAQNRGKKVPGGICGMWGDCGAAVSAGIFFSIAAKSSPICKETWGNGNIITGKCLEKIGIIGGPRCCKRNGYTAMLTTIDFTNEKLGIQMEKPLKTICTFTHLNNECIKERCPFHPINNK